VQHSSPAASVEPLVYHGPGVVSEFQTVSDVEALGTLNAPHLLRFGEDMLSAPSSPLFEPARLPDRIVWEHTNRILVGGAEYYAVTDHELGGYGLLHSRGKVFVHDRIQPHGFNHVIKSEERIPSHWISGMFSAGTETIEADALVGVVLNAHLVWGHFLLEMMARVHLLAKLRELGKPIRIAVPIDGPIWVQEFIALYFSTDEIIFYEASRHRVRAQCFILPSSMELHYYLHPAINLVVEELLQRVVPSYTGKRGSKRLYLSRSHHKGGHEIENEIEVESTLSNAGFTIVHPQEMSLLQQLALYSDAECIVSLYSSALHNTIFAPRGTAVFCFGWMNRCQSGIAALRGQPTAYMSPSDSDIIFPPANREPGPFKMRIDCRKLPYELDAFLRFAGLQGIAR
jgi:Glycosyltransferase 61